MVLADRFVAYGPSHWAALGLFMVGCVALILLGRTQRKPRKPDAQRDGNGQAALDAPLEGDAQEGPYTQPESEPPRDREPDAQEKPDVQQKQRARQLRQDGWRKRGVEFGDGARGFGRAFALAIVFSMIGTHSYTLLPGHWSVDGAVPLQLCDLAWPVAVWALWTFDHRAFAVLYYWGLTVSVQGLLTPAMNGHDYPSIRYLDFFGEHLLIVWAAVYLTWGVGMRPGWHGYRFAVAATAVWAATAFVVNLIAQTDFGYLNRKPDTGSILNLMGPWPWYLLVEAAIILAGWALITWPWTTAPDNSQA